MSQAKEELAKREPNYRLHLERIEEINRHKWLESQKQNKDVGWEWALCDWLMRFNDTWTKWRKKELGLCTNDT